MIRRTGAFLELRNIIMVVAIAAAIYHFGSTQYLLEDAFEYRNTHLAFCLVLVFLSTMEKKKKLWSLMPVLAVLAIVGSMYLKIFGEELEWRAGLPTIVDVVIGWMLILLVLEAARQAYGLVFPLLAVAAIGYMFLGSYVPGILRSPEIGADRIVSFLAIAHQDSGIFGTLLGVSAKYIFLFVLFGGLIEASGAGGFFRQLAILAARKMAGGPAMGAVISSGLVGMITGAPIANVAITGAYTIPAMKKAGVKPEQAGAFEACASAGGPLMPPVMGGTAFLMVGLLGVPYATVCAMAAIPAILYFSILGIQAQLVGMKLKIGREQQPVDRTELVLRAPTFIIPLLVIVAILVAGYTAMFASFWAIVVLLVIGSTIPGARASVSDWVRGCVNGARTAAKTAAACACIGILVTCFTTTGLGLKMPVLVEEWSGGILLVALLITVVVSYFMGCGMPGPATYVLVALIAAPALVRLGVELKTAHMFVFLCSMWSGITPPVAMAALVASSIAGAPFLKTALESVKIGVALLVLPFFIIWCPVLVRRPMGGGVAMAGASLLAIVVGLVAFSIALRRQYFTSLGAGATALSAVSALTLFAFVFTKSYPILAVGIILFSLLTIGEFRRRRSVNLQESYV